MVDLCGTWNGYEYCGLDGRPVKVEIIRITREKDRWVAAKITGDKAVPAGMVTRTHAGQLQANNGMSFVWMSALLNVTNANAIRVDYPEAFELRIGFKKRHGAPAMIVD